MMKHRMNTPAALFLALFLSLCNCFPSSRPDGPLEFDGQSAFSILVKQCEFGPRVPGTKAHLACRDYLVRTLEARAEEVLTQPFKVRFGTPETDHAAYNIIARFRTADPERILLCAHWDSRPWANEDPDPSNRMKPVPGANDGASGVAVLLELAEMLHSRPPEIGVDIVLFDGEDAGTSGKTRSYAQGSAYFAAHIPWEHRPLFGVLLDMIGDKELALEKEVNSWTYAREIMEDIWTRAAGLGLEAFKPGMGLAIFDDHIALLEVGIPCVDLIDFDYPYWHTVEDTPDKCSAESLSQIGTLLVDLIYNRD